MLMQADSCIAGSKFNDLAFLVLAFLVTTLRVGGARSRNMFKAHPPSRAKQQEHETVPASPNSLEHLIDKAKTLGLICVAVAGAARAHLSGMQVALPPMGAVEKGYASFATRPALMSWSLKGMQRAAASLRRRS
jgi:hypothetical protein